MVIVNTIIILIQSSIGGKMLHTKKKGYCEGTTHPTFGYSTNDCHYQYTREDINNRFFNEAEELISNIKQSIPYKSLEGGFILRIIRKKYNLIRPNIEKAEKQIWEFKQQEKRLRTEIDEYNQSLMIKCVLIGLLVITIPFCFMHYQGNKRDFYIESARLKNKLIDNKLQEEVEKYTQELNKCEMEIQEYKLNSTNIVNKNNNDKMGSWYSRAKNAYKQKDFKDFVFYIMKSARENNPKAIYFIGKCFLGDDVFKKNTSKAIYFLLYSSYLGYKKASKKIADILLHDNEDEEYKVCFLNKSRE